MTTTFLFFITEEVMMQGQVVLPQMAPLSQKDFYPPHQQIVLLVPEPHTSCKRCQSFSSLSSVREENPSSYLGSDQLPDFRFDRSLTNYLTGIQIHLHLHYIKGLRLLRLQDLENNPSNSYSTKLSPVVSSPDDTAHRQHHTI